MEKIIMLHNVFTGARLTQAFGENPSMYKKYGLRGHEGIDFVLPGDGMIFSPISGVCVVDHDTIRGDYGIFVCLHDVQQQIMLWLCHMRYNLCDQDQRYMTGRHLGKMGNTGHSLGKHVHLMLCRVRDMKRLDYDNGYKGMIDPLGPDVQWVPNIPGTGV